jgi:hypothetical protein
MSADEAWGSRQAGREACRLDGRVVMFYEPPHDVKEWYVR